MIWDQIVITFLLKVRAIVRNRTGIEEWILEKAKYRREGTNEIFLFPYDLGTWENIKQVFYWTDTLPIEGIIWPIRDGCNEFTLTVRIDAPQLLLNLDF